MGIRTESYQKKSQKKSLVNLKTAVERTFTRKTEHQQAVRNIKYFKMHVGDAAAGNKSL